MSDDRAISQIDRDVIRSAATGEGLIEITTADFAVLAEHARATKAGFDGDFASMTKDQAAFVRRLRVDDGFTWRAVAETCALEWGGDRGSNQLAGMALCQRAAAMFGEGMYDEGTWN